MYLLRTYQNKDLDAIIDLAFQGQLGMTNLPKNRQRLKEMGELSLHSFEEMVAKPSNHFYIFVLEEIETSKVVGVSGILGTTPPLDYYRVTSVNLPRLFEEVPRQFQVLERVKYPHGPSEICALFLSGAYREHGLGKLLSLSRFHFIASFPERFCDQIFANMRGIILPSGECPFWEGVGRSFLPIPFSELMTRRDEQEEPISSLMPSFPIYIDLLPETVKNAIGQTHVNTHPALKMLLELGFSPTGEVDLFDAGPIISAKTSSVKTVKESKTFPIDSIASKLNAPLHLISNTRIDFKAAWGQIDIKSRRIDQKTADLLEVKIGTIIRYSP
jgi:arginine N-succinyltransferase